MTIVILNVFVVMNNDDFDDLKRIVLAARESRLAYMENEIRRGISEQLQAVMVSKGWSAKDLAKEMNVSLDVVYRLLNIDCGDSVTIRDICTVIDVLGLRANIKFEKMP